MSGLAPSLRSLDAEAPLLLLRALEGGGVMPALTMRGRYLMREYWTDSDLFLKLDASEREVYVALWMYADDAGWVPRDVPAIAGGLAQYEDRSTREARTRAALERLRDLGKVLSHRCCLYLPAVERYPRAGRKSFEHRIEHERHQKHSNKSIDIQRDLNPSPVPSLPYPSLPDVAGARARGGAPRRFSELVPRPGLKATS